MLLTDHFGESFSLLAQKLKILWLGIKLHNTRTCFNSAFMLFISICAIFLHHGLFFKVLLVCHFWEGLNNQSDSYLYSCLSQLFRGWSLITGGAANLGEAVPSNFETLPLSWHTILRPSPGDAHLHCLSQESLNFYEYLIWMFRHY